MNIFEEYINKITALILKNQKLLKLDSLNNFIMLIEIRGEIEEIRMITAFEKEINSHPQRSDAESWTPNKQPMNTL